MEVHAMFLALPKSSLAAIKEKYTQTKMAAIALTVALQELPAIPK
jgi:hypothetical protein